MTGFRFPNETDEYRARRDELLELEVRLRALGEEVTQARLALPRGGRLREDYVFESVDRHGSVRETRFSELFGERDGLLVYTMMFGPEWDAACPSCTSLVDAFNANWYPFSQHAAMAVVAAAGPEQLAAWGRRRGWRLPLHSAAKNDYILDYFAQDATDPAMVTMMNAFRRTPEGIFHHWGSELVRRPMENAHARHVDAVWPFWNLLDMTPGGRPDRGTPIQDYEHAWFTEHVWREPD